MCTEFGIETGKYLLSNHTSSFPTGPLPKAKSRLENDKRETMNFLKLETCLPSFQIFDAIVFEEKNAEQ